MIVREKTSGEVREPKNSVYTMVFRFRARGVGDGQREFVVSRRVYTYLNRTSVFSLNPSTFFYSWTVASGGLVPTGGLAFVRGLR